ncbi:glycosyltransferase [Selenomonas sp.]|uniref:glycosyltransferase n=1 Tax=Selenomonas sp. TaxID=2053611 RepID=UPI0025DBA30D|nr:glycosyltransferase [Selenomonas sp.]MCI6283028.1 glycosyltransferase [Selenomonas sp.]
MRILLANFTKMIGDSGGLAKVNCAFANAMVERGNEVAMVYSDDREGAFFFPVDARVKCYNLRHFRGQSILFPVSLKIKREVLRAIDVRKGRAVNNDFVISNLKENVQAILVEFSPDVIIAFQPASAMIYVSVLHVTIPVICMSHGDPEDYFHTYDPRELPALEKCAACQVLLPSFREHLLAHFPKVNISVIGNVVPQYETPANLAGKKETYKILFLGRLVKNHKRPHLLIEAFAQIANEFPNWQVELWGAEDKKSYTEALQRLISKYHLGQCVFLRGSTHEVEKVLRTGDIFAFPSAYEGFGLSLAEAMSMGLPAVGYRKTVAVNELIVDGLNGFLCEDGVADFAAHLRQLMEDHDLRIRMGKAARASVQKYAAERIWKQWEELIQEVCDESS